MARAKKDATITIRSLIFFLFLTPLCLKAETFNIGTITQSEGEITFLQFAPPHKLHQVQKDQQLQSDGSYLTQDSSYMTIKFFDGTWLRVSPKSKFTVEYQPQASIILVHLYTGSIKILFSTNLNKNKIQKIIVKSADTLFETVDAKFSVIRNPVLDINSVYVEKGTVLTTQHVLNQKKNMEIVHTGEMVSVKDNETDIEKPTKLSVKEMKFLHSAQYLKKAKSTL